MKYLLFVLFLVSVVPVFSQETEVPNFTAVDSLYREDQFYFSFTYNILENKSSGIKQNKFSSGLAAGFLRDMPINKRRTYSIAVGLGYSLQNYNQNIIISEVDGVRQYSIIEANTDYDKDKISLNFIDLPIEFRWRTSTPESHKFWRIYTGLKFSYLFYSRSKYVSADQNSVVTQNEDFNKFRYGVYLATGYNTWNFHVYYGLNPIFKNAAIDGKPIDVRTLNIGLMFYIL